MAYLSLDRKELKECKRLAKKGDAEAQCSLGKYYYFKYMRRNHNPKAVKWYTLAADQGHAEAQYQLSEFYRIGMYVRENNDKAMYYLKKAAAQGHAKAQEKLGIKPTTGQSAKTSVKQSATIDKKTQELLATKQPTLSTLKQLVEAGMELNSPLTEREKFGIIVNSVLSGEIKANDELCYSIGESYFYAKHGASCDYEKAVYWWRKAARNGHADSQYALAYCYNLGFGVEQDDYECERWLLSAARLGNEQARQALRDEGKRW